MSFSLPSCPLSLHPKKKALLVKLLMANINNHLNISTKLSIKELTIRMKISFRLLLVLSAFALAPVFTTAQNVEEGKKLFEANCTSCHQVYSEVVGPALKDVDKRRDEAWIIKWVKNSQAVIKSGDAYAVALANKYNNAVMTSFGSLKDAEIKSILAYIKTAPAPGPLADDPSKPPVNPNDPKPSDGANNSTMLMILLGLAFVLGLTSILLGRVAVSLKGTLYTAQPELAPEERIGFWDGTFWPWVSRWNKTVATISFMLCFVFLYCYWGFGYANNEVGVQKGYAPTQPIAYSHKIHAGQYKIQCQYCHSTAEKSKQASIPSPSTCMNCHVAVQAKEKYAGKISPEIMKIYNAVGYNPETKKYDVPQKPIKWVRIHNLPDFAYFNHSQHVKVGKIACQKCHGDIQNMTVVYQKNTLQMGWCIQCHRESKVDMANNKYYEKIHAKYKALGKKEVTVAENGGLDCSKCHY